MKIKRFNTGGFMTNSYLTWEEDGTAYLFDCEGERIDLKLKEGEKIGN